MDTKQTHPIVQLAEFLKAPFPVLEKSAEVHRPIAVRRGRRTLFYAIDARVHDALMEYIDDLVDERNTLAAILKGGDLIEVSLKDL